MVKPFLYLSILMNCFSSYGAPANIEDSFTEFMRQLENPQCEAILSGNSLLSQQGIYADLLHHYAQKLSPEAKLLIQSQPSKKGLMLNDTPTHVTIPILFPRGENTKFGVDLAESSSSDLYQSFSVGPGELRKNQELRLTVPFFTPPTPQMLTVIFTALSAVPYVNRFSITLDFDYSPEYYFPRELTEDQLRLGKEKVDRIKALFRGGRSPSAIAEAMKTDLVREILGSSLSFTQSGVDVWGYNTKTYRPATPAQADHFAITYEISL